MTGKKDRSVRVAALKISNILGIKEAEIKPGKVTIIEGANGTGKTSILEAFRSVLQGGHDATLLRHGAEVGEIVMILDDGQRIQKDVTADRTDITVTHPEFGALKKPRTLIDKLCDAFALNPVDFLVAKKETRLQLLLSAIPLKVSALDLADILPLCANPINCDRNALQVIADIHSALYDERRSVNRSLKEKKITIEELKKALPPEATNGDSVEQLSAARAAQRAYMDDQNARERDLTVHTHAEIQEAENDRQARINHLSKRRDEELESIHRAYNTQATTIIKEANMLIESIRAQSDKEFKNATDEARIHERELAQTVATAEIAVRTFERAQAARDHAASLESTLPQLEKTASDLDGALSELDTIKSDLLDRLPIKGVELRDGEIFVDQIPFERLNESRRVRLAIDVAMLRAGSLPLLCCDGIESLDSKSITALEQCAAESGIQLVLARVTDGELDVKVIS